MRKVIEAFINETKYTLGPYKDTKGKVYKGKAHIDGKDKNSFAYFKDKKAYDESCARRKVMCGRNLEKNLQIVDKYKKELGISTDNKKLDVDFNGNVSGGFMLDDAEIQKRLEKVKHLPKNEFEKVKSALYQVSADSSDVNKDVKYRKESNK